MKFLTLFVTLLSFHCFADDFKAQAKKILAPIKKAFMQELKVGMQEGPYEAMDSCHLKAPHLIEHDHEQFEIGRTSNKIRNKNNKPKAWMKDILEEFKDSTAQKPLSAKVFTVEKNKKVYVEPIYIKAVCLNCHGSRRGSVAKKLNTLYPNDEATGYKIGEFRGLFYIKSK